MVNRDAHLWVVTRCVTVVLLQSVLLQSSDNGLSIVDRPKVLDDDLMVRHNEDDSGVLANAILAANARTACLPADGGVLNAVCVHPIETSRIAVASGDFHIEHIMHVATHSIVGFDNFRGGLLARAAGSEEEIDEDGLSTVEDVEQVDFGAVDVSSRKVNGLCQRTLRFKAETDGQRENKGNKFFHKR